MKYPPTHFRGLILCFHAAYLQVLGHVQDAGQLGLVVLLSSHVPLCHRVHNQLADGWGLALQIQQKNNTVSVSHWFFRLCVVVAVLCCKTVHAVC